MVHVAILAGAKRKNYIRGEAKCFKDMPTGECIVEEILHALKGIKKVEDIVIVGPEEGLGKLKIRDLSHFKKKIFLVKQGKSIQENLILAKEELTIRKKRVSGLLYILGDTPFRKRISIEEFISQIDQTNDVVISYTPEKIIRKYLLLFPKPLIPLCLQGVPGNFKETNMFYFNPDKIEGDLAKRFYRLRHTSRFRSMLELRRIIYSLGGKEVMKVLTRAFVVRQWHKMFRGFMPRWFHTPVPLYRRLEKDKIMRLAYQKFHLKMDIVFSSYPDGFIDVDNSRDYRKIYRHFFEINKEVTKDVRVLRKLKSPL
ncbi:MAG: hypothetical protein ABIJ21_00315 [Nanoarchaeota archaeon]